jgi:hypothetical protein
MQFSWRSELYAVASDGFPSVYRDIYQDLNKLAPNKGANVHH